MGNRLMMVIFSICIALGVLLLEMLLTEPSPGAAGAPHPSIAGMQVGGDGLVRLESIGVYAFLFQTLLLLLICCLCALGVSKRYRSLGFYICLSAAYGVMLLVWWQMVSGHQAFMATGETSYFLGFPTATAWQMYGTWISAMPLVFMYIFGFAKFIYTKEDEAAFKRIIADQQAREGSN